MSRNESEAIEPRNYFFKRRGRYCDFGSRQHYANHNGEICMTLPGSEGLASLMISMLLEQMRSCNA